MAHTATSRYREIVYGVRVRISTGDPCNLWIPELVKGGGFPSGDRDTSHCLTGGGPRFGVGSRPTSLTISYCR